MEGPTAKTIVYFQSDCKSTVTFYSEQQKFSVAHCKMLLSRKGTMTSILTFTCRYIGPVARVVTDHLTGLVGSPGEAVTRVTTQGVLYVKTRCHLRDHRDLTHVGRHVFSGDGQVADMS